MVHFSFFSHKRFSYLAAIAGIPSGRHHLPHSGKSHSSPSLSLLKTAEQNQQGSCNLEHHPDTSTLSLSLYMDFRASELHSSYSHKPVGKKALWFSECDRRFFACSSCCSKEGFSETCLILLNKQFLSSSRQAGDLPGKVVSLVRDQLTLHLPDKGQHFHVLYVMIGDHQLFQLLNHLSITEQSQTPVADNGGGDWTTTALKWATPLQDT